MPFATITDFADIYHPFWGNTSKRDKVLCFIQKAIEDSTAPILFKVMIYISSLIFQPVAIIPLIVSLLLMDYNEELQ